MILTGLMYFLQAIIGFILGLLPVADATVTTGISTFSTSFRSYYTLINWAFPIDNALFILSVIVIIEVGLLLFKLVRLVFHWS